MSGICKNCIYKEDCIDANTPSAAGCDSKEEDIDESMDIIDDHYNEINEDYYDYR